jgi:hypothetical protein
LSRRRGNEIDWATEAINSPAGKLAEILMTYADAEAVEAGEFSASWIGRVEELLDLQGDSKLHAIVIFSFNLNWFYSRSSHWTDNRILSFIQKPGEAREAVFAGLFWNSTIPHQALYTRLKPYFLDIAEKGSPTKRRHLEVLAGLILAGWASREQVSHKRFVSDQEMRRLLLEAGDSFRRQIVYHLKRWKSSPEMKSEFPSLFSDAWPRQKKIRTPSVSAALCDLALSEVDDFPIYADKIIPFLSRMDGARSFGFHGDTAKRIVEKWPEKLLEFATVSLPEDASGWPYGSNEIVEKIGVVRPELLKDSRLIELRRQWNSQ